MNETDAQNLQDSEFTAKSAEQALAELQTDEALETDSAEQPEQSSPDGRHAAPEVESPKEQRMFAAIRDRLKAYREKTREAVVAGVGAGVALYLDTEFAQGIHADPSNKLMYAGTILSIAGAVALGHVSHKAGLEAGDAHRQAANLTHLGETGQYDVVEGQVVPRTTKEAKQS